MKKIASGLLLPVLMLLLAACSPSDSPAADAAAAEPSFENAWVRAIQPGMKMTAGFGTLVNHLDEQIDITSVSSPGFQSVSVHRTEVVGGVSSMKEVEFLPIGAGSSLAMEPGGYHLMLMGPRQPVSPGATVTLEFHAADGRVFSFDVPVEKR